MKKKKTAAATDSSFNINLESGAMLTRKLMKALIEANPPSARDTERLNFPFNRNR